MADACTETTLATSHSSNQSLYVKQILQLRIKAEEAREKFQ
jgi:hypothetical protein